ncbi:MAG: glycerate kinase, partial [Actinomycetota bacterium]
HQLYVEQFGVDVRDVEGAGAAGGLAGGLAALGAQLVPGFDVVADEIGLDDRVDLCDIVITGEGFLDEQSFAGKVVGGMQGLAEMKHKRFGAIVGDADITVNFPVANLTALYGLHEATTKTRTSIERAAIELLRRLAA